MLVAVLAAVTVTVAMRTVGLLLVSALMVVPVATAQQVTRSFRTTLGLAMVLGVVASVGGLVLRRSRPYQPTSPPGPTIVLLALAGFVLTWPIGVLAAAPAAAARAVPRGRAVALEPRRRPRGTRTSTARTAATSPSSTATTSTTSTTGTGTPPTGAL